MKFPFFAQSIDGYVAVLTLDKQYLVYVVCCCLQFFPAGKQYTHQKLDGEINTLTSLFLSFSLFTCSCQPFFDTIVSMAAGSSDTIGEGGAC